MTSEVIEGHIRPPFYLDDFCLKYDHIKTLCECLQYKDASFHKMVYDLYGHVRSQRSFYAENLAFT